MACVCLFVHSTDDFFCRQHFALLWSHSSVPKCKDIVMCLDAFCADISYGAAGQEFKVNDLIHVNKVAFNRNMQGTSLHIYHLIKML